VDGRPNRRNKAGAERTSFHAVFKCLDFADLAIPVYRKRSMEITIAF